MTEKAMMGDINDKAVVPCAGDSHHQQVVTSIRQQIRQWIYGNSSEASTTPPVLSAETFVFEKLAPLLNEMVNTAIVMEETSPDVKQQQQQHQQQHARKIVNACLRQNPFLSLDELRKLMSTTTAANDDKTRTMADNHNHQHHHGQQEDTQSLSSNADASGSNVETSNVSLRRIQVQILLRLYFWNRFGNVFVQRYNAKILAKKNNKKKSAATVGTTARSDKEQALLNRFLDDMIAILSMAAFLLPQNESMVVFLQECLPKSFLETQPQQQQHQPLLSCHLARIYDFFEVPNPCQAQKDDVQESALDLLLNSPLKKMKQSDNRKRKAGSQQQQQEEKESKKTKNNQNDATAAAGDDGNDATTATMRLLGLELPAQMTLMTAGNKKPNSLLGNSGSQRFVGSHFNSNLSNMSHLFRQVRIPTVSNTTNSAAAAAGKLKQNNLSSDSQKKNNAKTTSIRMPPPAPGAGAKMQSILKHHHPHGVVAASDTTRRAVFAMPPPPPNPAPTLLRDAMDRPHQHQQPRPSKKNQQQQQHHQPLVAAQAAATPPRSVHRKRSQVLVETPDELRRSSSTIQQPKPSQRRRTSRH